MASSAIGFKLGYSGFADHTRGNTHKQNASTIFAPHAAYHACLFSHSEPMAQVLGSPMYICDIDLNGFAHTYLYV